MRRRPRLHLFEAVAALCVVACTPPEGGRAPAVLAGDAAGSPAGAAAAEVIDTLPPPLMVPVEEEPRGEGPLFPFADSTTQPARWGLRDGGGRVNVPAQYAYATPMFGGFAAVAVSEEWGMPRWGYVDASGQVAIAPRFEAAGRFANGRVLVMLDGDLMFVDAGGTVVERVAAADSGKAGSPALPEPCDSCSLREYARRLARVGVPQRLSVQPLIGESYRARAVQRHPDGLVSMAEGGWEDWGYDLRIPGISREQGIALAKRIMGEGLYVERRDEDEPAAVVLEGTGSRADAGYEEMRVRVRNGVVELSHAGGV